VTNGHENLKKCLSPPLLAKKLQNIHPYIFILYPWLLQQRKNPKATLQMFVTYENSKYNLLTQEFDSPSVSGLRVYNNGYREGEEMLQMEP
jgi:hypothetical protein